MRRVNLLEFHNLFISQDIKKEELMQYLELYHLKEHEFQDLNELCVIFKDKGIETFSPHIFENYYVNYAIAQIGKEFDILRIGENSVVNIELKSQKDESSILKQLQRNYYYLSFLQKEIYCFTFVSKTGEFYYFDKSNEKLESVTAERILGEISEFDDIETQIDDLFVPSNYLISPFNNTEQFLKNEYFLTKSQKEIKDKILKAIDNNACKIFSIEGRAGTGKTLLTYDLANTLTRKGYKVAIIHCALLNSGIVVLKQNNWNIIPIKHLRTYEIEQKDDNIFIIDEAQRLTILQVEYFLKTNKIFIFAHDVQQKLNRTNKAEEVVALIKESANEHYEISAKIRHNKALASFIKKLFKLAKITSDEFKGNDYKDISFYYATDNEDARKYIEYLKKQDWEYIHLTASNNASDKLKSVEFGSKQSAHQVIGQEFNNVIVVISSDFYYNDDKMLKYKDTTWHYNPLETLYQAASRTRKKLKFIIINNLEVYKACMKIIHRNE